MILLSRHFKLAGIVVATALFSACASYYTKNLKFQEQVQNGQFEKAEATLEGNKKAQNKRNQLLYYLEHGYVDWMMANYNESNDHFASADRLIEDHIKNYGREALALVTNPGVKPYQPEDFEVVLLNYFKALNYLSLNDYEAALVECRKINIKLNSLNDKYKDHKNRYQRDAFAHNMMGMIYEANGDYNNAFIAYRNALEVYEEDYKDTFGVGIPHQLKLDLIRTAQQTGFYEEARFYQEKFGIESSFDPTSKELVVFWLNGFGPVKSEWSINLTSVKGEGGWITFADEDYGISVPVYIGDKSDEEKSAFENLSFLRIAFPKYETRLPVYEKAYVTSNGENADFEISQNINEIAYKTLRDRMLREVGSAVARLATKKALEALASKENEGLGTLVSITNAITEKADTRNWQTLPYSISYARVPFPEKGTINMKAIDENGPDKEYTLTVPATNKRISFYSFHTIESHPPGFIVH